MVSLGLGLLIIGAALAVGVGWLLHRFAVGQRFPWLALLVGAVAFVAAMLAQNILVAPVALLIHGAAGMKALTPSSVWEAVYYGLGAGIAQEVLRCLGIRWYGKRHGFLHVAIAVGAGFALAEIILVSAPAVATTVAPAAVVVPVWERLSAIFFHIGAAAIIAYGLARGRVGRYLVLAILLHAAADGTVSLMQMYHVHAVYLFESLNFVYSALVLGLGVWWLRKAAGAEQRIGESRSA